jgi:NAD(P)-dependent dehydrogenase (short-subunit alcohol dehydrogenase family)
VERIWFVTGASRGIGEAVARRAAAQGDSVVLVARGAAVERVAAEVGGVGIRADVLDHASLGQAVDEGVARFGRIDVLVNNAGIHKGGRLDRLTVEDFEDVLRADLIGPFETCRLAVPHMPPGSAVVNVGAVVGFRGFPGDSPYGAAKAGLAGLTRVLAVELARLEITVNLVVPGLTDTNILDGVDERARARLLERVPLRRMGTPDEVAQVVCWVASSRYMTGSVVPVDGGMMAQL